MTLQRIKPWLVLSLIFIAGVVTGGLLTWGCMGSFMHPPGPQQMKAHFLMHLTHRLNLTPDQQAKIEPILADAESQIQSLHRDEVGRISKVMEDIRVKISPILTPDQQVELQKMDKEREKMFSGHMRPWMGPGGPQDHETPPGGDGQPPPPPQPTTP